MIGKGERRRKKKTKKSKSCGKKRRASERAGPLNPISPDEGYANDPEELNPTSHSKFGEGPFN